MIGKLTLSLAGFFLATATMRANPPVASYIFPPGGQRGQTVPVRVGGLFLHQSCGYEMLGPGIKGNSAIKRMKNLWFEGPLLPLPASQQAEDYPKDMAGKVEISPTAAAGLRYWRLWTSQGATPAMKFMVGDLPEIVEEEFEGDPIPVKVRLPLTINGRIFPREDVDLWTFHARKGQQVRCEVHAARLGSPLDARLEVLDARGVRLAENDDAAGADPIIHFTAPADGDFQVRIQDTRALGGPAYVYRLTLTSEPFVDYCYPLGGRRGTKIQARLAGQGLPNGPVEISFPAVGGPDHPLRLNFNDRKTNEFLLDLDDLPEFEESANKEKIFAVPAVFNGRIISPGEIDSWSIAGKKGQVLQVELRAGRLGSPLDGVIRLLDPSGKEISRAEAGPGQLDPLLTFTVAKEGTYTVQVHDRFGSRGGPAFAYRLRVAVPGPADFVLRPATDAVTLPRKGQARLKILVERKSGFKEPIVLSVTGLPAGVTVTGTTIAAGQNGADLSFKAEATAPIKPAFLTIQGSAKVGTATITRRAKLAGPRGAFEPVTVLLMVSLPTPFKIKGEYDMGFAPRGSVRKRKYTIERNGYDGPIEVSLADRQARHLQGVTGPTIIVPAGAKEFSYPATLPPWMETGRTCRVCVMGVGAIKDADGSVHPVSFSSVNQNEQLVAVVGPGKLAMELDRTSITIKPGQTIKLGIQIKRALGVKGPVQLELEIPRHIHGLKALPGQILVDQERGDLTIQAQNSLAGPFNMPLTVRATLIHQGQPLTAEAKVEVVPGGDG